MILLGVQLGSLLAVYAPGIDPSIIGPFRPLSYVAAYTLIALPNAFIATTVQYSTALLSGRSMAGYFGSIVLLFFTVPVPLFLWLALGQQQLALMADPIGLFAIMNEMMLNWTIVEKNERMFTLEGSMLLNRLLWLGIAATTLTLVHLRFRFAHLASTDPWTRFTRRFFPKPADPELVTAGRRAVPVPNVQQAFGLATQVRQMLAIATSSFRMIATSIPGLFLLVAFPAFVVLLLVTESVHWDVPLLPPTGYLVTKHLTSPLTQFADYRVIIPLLVIYFAGELVWRERDARLSDNIDATSVHEWVLFVGKYLGLAMVLAALMASLTAAGMVAQTIMGYYHFEPLVYLKMFYGLQLPEYLLFAMLVFGIQAVVNQKQLALLVCLVSYFLIIFAPRLGIEHNLLIYTAGPEWLYTQMRGFGSSIGPWLWFKLYWSAWALLLAVATRLLWVRGRESGFRQRLRIARHRITRSTAGVAAMAIALILTLGGFIFYNTNVLNEFRTAGESVERAAEYEKRYGRYEGIPQPERVATKLDIEIYPRRRTAAIRGSYILTNRDAVAIDSVHIETPSALDTRISFNRAARLVLEDDDLGHSIYALDDPLQPGESVTLEFDATFAPRGFRNSGNSMSIVPNGSYFTGGALPSIGYQPSRELVSATDRRKHGLAREVTFPTPDDVNPDMATGLGATFEAVISTDEGQVAVAPGALRRTWTENGRHYSHYASDVPISGQYVFFSADYVVHREQWNGVDVQVYTDPRDTTNVDRLLRGARASFDYYTTQFGPYPFPFLQFIEQAANGMGMGVDGSGVITGLEGFFLLRPEGDGVDAVFQIVAHEMGHQWWGGQLKYAPAEGAIVLSESLAWYSAIQVVNRANGPKQLRRFMRFLREPVPWPPIRTGLPLLRAMDPWAGYRKGAYAMYALSEYLGEDRVNGALRSLLLNKAGTQATTMDLYRELRAAAPDSMQYLLHDLFEVNTFWELETESISAVETAAGTWQVTLGVKARKIVADSAGVETEMAMDEWIPIGVFGAVDDDDELGNALHMQMHRIRSGAQRITITVSAEPVFAGIDPHHLLDWVEEGDDDNVDVVTITSKAKRQE